MAFADNVRALGLPLDQIVVIGSGLLDQLGLRQSHDIDLVVSSAVFDSVGKDSSYTFGEKGSNRFAVRDDIEIWDGWEEVTYDQLRETAQPLGGVLFVSTDVLIAKKTQRGLSKDLNDIKLLEEYYGRTT